MKDFEEVGYVYFLINSEEPERKRYLGCSVQPKKRLYQHKRNSKAKKNHRDCWIQSINTNPEMVIEAVVKRNLMPHYEKFLHVFMMKTGEAEDLTNDTICGGMPPREAWNKGKQLSQEHIENLRKSHLGYKRSKESNEKIRMKLTGRKISEKTKMKIKNSLTGVKHTEKRKDKFRKREKLKMLSILTNLNFNSDDAAFYLYEATTNQRTSLRRRYRKLINRN